MNRRVYTLIVMSFLFAGGYTAVSPILPDVVASFDVSVTQAGLLLSAFAGGRMAFGIIGGMIADRLSVGVVVTSACLLVLTSAVATVVTEDFGILLTARVLQGVGTAIYMVAATGYLIDVVPQDRLPKMLAWNQSLLLVGMSVGPTLGGLAAAVGGYRGTFALFAVYGALGTLTSLIMLRGAPRTESSRKPAQADTGPENRASLTFRTLLTPILLAALAVSVIAAAVRSGVRSTIAPLYATELLGFDTIDNGLLLTVAGLANIAVMWPVAKSIELAGWRRVMAITTPLSAAPLALLALVNTEWQMYVVLAVLSMVTGFSGVVTGTAIAELVAPSVRKTIIGVDRTVRDFAFMISPVAMTAVVGAYGYETLFWWFAAGVFVLGLVVAFATYRLSRQQGPSPEGADQH